MWWFNPLRLLHELIDHVAPPVHQHQRVLELLLHLVVLQPSLLLPSHHAARPLVLLLFFVVGLLLDHAIEKLEVGNAEFTHLLEDLLDVEVTQLGQVLVQVLGD